MGYYKFTVKVGYGARKTKKRCLAAKGHTIILGQHLFLSTTAIGNFIKMISKLSSYMVILRKVCM